MGRSGRRHVLRSLLITVLVLLVIAVAADRGGDYAAEHAAADNLKSSQNLDDTPDVEIHGFPFLTQFATGHYDHISVDGDEIPVKPASIKVSHLHIDLNQVTVSRNFTHFHANSATANALIDYADLSRRLHISLSYAGNDRIRASKRITIPIVDKTITPTITVKPSLINGSLGFGKTTINGAGIFVSQIASIIDGTFGISVPLQNIPFDVTVRSLRVDEKGLELDLVGSDLNYSK